MNTNIVEPKSKTHFNLPKSTSCIVVYHDKGANHEVLLPTPANNNQLVHVMLGRRIGFSQIRAVKAVTADDFRPKQLAGRW